MSDLRTDRGFPYPRNLPETLTHSREAFIVVRLTEWEIKQLSPEISGCDGNFCLLIRDDRTYDLVRREVRS